MMSRLVPINKGNYSLETSEREELFEKYRGEGWEEEYYTYRKNWTLHPQTQYVSDYPLLVDLELSTVCNLSCPMCYTVTEQFKSSVRTQFMDYTLFCKIIDEISGKVPAIRLSLRGESTLHPRFIDCITYAKSKGIKEVSTLTNGSQLKPEFFEAIMEAGIDWITISVDGLHNTYENIRRPLKFIEMFEKIKAIQKIKQLAGRNRPVIKIQSIWTAIANNPEEFYNTFAPYVDVVAFNPVINYDDNPSKIQYEEGFQCPQIYQRLVIAADGKALMCACDEFEHELIADANHQSIKEIWHGEQLTRIRDSHRKIEGFKELEVCRTCYVPRATIACDGGIVNGRRILVREYVKGE
jgi:sulfatase maturation enzyme AslB (radical SAM superfamily)